jgi:hypothetical protein
MPLAHIHWNNQQMVLQEIRSVWGHGPSAQIQGARGDRQRTFNAFTTFNPPPGGPQRRYNASQFSVLLEYAGKDAQNRDTFNVIYTGKSAANDDFRMDVGTITDG